MSFTEAYMKAEYHVDGFEQPILVGRDNAELADLLLANGATEWCFITAWNPMSHELPRDENNLRNSELRKELAKYVVLEGDGRDPEGLWEPERSFLVIGIAKETAIALAKQFNQRAILYGTDSKAELHETSY